MAVPSQIDPSDAAGAVPLGTVCFLIAVFFFFLSSRLSGLTCTLPRRDGTKDQYIKRLVQPAPPSGGHAAEEASWKADLDLARPRHRPQYDAVQRTTLCNRNMFFD